MTSPVITDTHGYTSDDYLTGDYDSGGFLYAYGMQVQMVVSTTKTVGQQVDMVVSSSRAIGFQTLMTVNSSKHVGQQAFMHVADHLTPKGMQVDMTIGGATHYGQQSLMTVASSKHVGQQALMNISGHLDPIGQQVDMIDTVRSNIGQQTLMTPAASKVLGQQALMDINQFDPIGQQVDMIDTTLVHVGQQTLMTVDATKVIGQQALMNISAYLSPKGMQVDMDTTLGKVVGMEAKADTLRHALLGYYLVDDYLVDAYLVDQMAAYMGMQVKAGVDVATDFGQQSLLRINKTRALGFQVHMVVEKEKALGQQVLQVIAYAIGQQAQMVVYNNTQFRILQTFPSRGTDGLNWTATNQATGDYSPNNLNTDVEEEVFRSTGTNVELVSDSQVTQGITIDTLSIRNHNLTKNATVQLQGSDSPSFSTVNVSIDLTVELKNMYYVAQFFPVGVANQNRYWKYVISDPTNPDGYIQIGIIIHGSADIFSVKENYDNPLKRGYKHFRDVNPTEGFTAKMNDRATRKYLTLRFTELERLHMNFALLEDYIVFARTSLKCLIIPTPMYPSRYAVFAKLVSMPEIEERDISDMNDPTGASVYVSLELNWDESL